MKATSPPTQFLDESKEKSQNADHFLLLVGKYNDIRKLDAEIIRECVECINVFQAKKVDKHRQQRIQIIYNYIDAVNLPDAE